MGDPPKASLVESMQDLELVRDLLPIWTDWGVEDSGVTVHQLGIIYLALLGQRLGYVGISERPAPHEGTFGFVGANVRPDAIWYDRTGRKPILVGEFERYKGVEDQEKLEGKVRNLVLAQHRLGGTATELVLAYWTPGLVSTPNHSSLRRIVSQGFTTPATQTVHGCSGHLRLFQFVVQKGQDGLLRLTRILSRDAK